MYDIQHNKYKLLNRIDTTSWNLHSQPREKHRLLFVIVNSLMIEVVTE